MRNQIFGSMDGEQDLIDPVLENHQIKRHSNRTGSLYGGQLELVRVPSKLLLEKTDQLAAQIQRIVKHMDFDLRQLKAERHIYDAYYLRTVRNDIDLENRYLLKFFWTIENNSIWTGFLFLFALVLQILTFFEKPYPTSSIEATDGTLLTELIILLGFMIDSSITFTLIITNQQKEWRKKLNFKRISKIVVILICLSDFIVAYVDGNTVRFSRLLRPILMVFYSKDLRRNLKGMIQASRDLLLLMLLYIIVISIFSFIGINLIGTIENVDLKTQDYGDFLKFSSMLFMVSTLDFYPDILIPPMLAGTYYILFFVIYLLLFVFLFYPIPLAVVYEGFRKHRRQIAINDIIKQKSAMMASFISLDTLERGYLSESQFKNFIKFLYKDQLTQDQLDIVYQEIDKDFNDKIQFDEFYSLIDVFHNSTVVGLPQTPPLKIWESFRILCNNRCGLKKFISGSIFNTTMLLVTIMNCVLIIIAFFIEDEDVLSIFNTLDTVFLVFYSLECIFKIIGLGIREFFDDGWNVFDFTLVILQVVFDYILFGIVTENLAQSIKANRILRLAKIQKVFRLFRAFRSIKIINYILGGFEILGAVQNLLYKIIICVPLILRLMLPVQLIFFTYSTVGIYLYGGAQLNPNNPYANPTCDLDEMNYIWGGCKYADFDSFYGAYLLMLQTFIAAAWSGLVFELTYDSDNMAVAMVYIGSFVFFSIFQLALIGGLVWEVFTVVSQSLRIEEMKSLENEMQQYQDEFLFSSQGTLTDLKPSNIVQESAANQLKKKTLILNDDNPDTLNIKRMARKGLSQTKKYEKRCNSEGSVHQKNSIPSEITHRVSMQVYNQMLNAGNSRSFAHIKVQPQGDIEDVEQSDTTIDMSKLYFDSFKDFEEYIRLKSTNQALQLSQVTKEYIIHLRNEIKKDEIFVTKSINIKNHDQLIQNAVLRDTSEQMIKQQEEKYFKVAFGQKFERIKELKFQSKFKIESKILFSLMGILKFPKPNIKYYFQILYLIESYFTYQLLPETSFFKFIHQHGKKWYVITIEDQQIVFSKISRGPWDYADELFLNTDFRIAENIKFLKEKHHSEYKFGLKEFRRSMGMLARQYEIDLSQLDIRSCCLMYHIKNDRYLPPDIISMSQKKSNKSLDESPQQFMIESKSSRLLLSQNINNNNNNAAVAAASQYQTTMNSSDIHKHVSRTIIFILSKTQAIEPRIVFQNQVLLSQFTQDLARVINTYSSNFFQQLEDLFEIKQQTRIKIKIGAEEVIDQDQVLGDIIQF